VAGLLAGSGAMLEIGSEIQNPLPGPLEYQEYQELYPPTGQFPQSRPEKALSSLVRFQLPPGQCFVLVIASCGAALGGPERESAPHSDLTTGIDETGHANSLGQGEQTKPR
jgi:hypothetical protein